MSTARRGSSLLFSLFLVQAAVSPVQAQIHEGTASSVFSFLRNLILFPPVTSQEDFELVEEYLNRQDSSRAVLVTHGTSTSWRYSTDSGLVSLLAQPSEGFFSLRFSPLQPSPFGDAALAALIDKAERVSAEEGDSLTLSMPVVHLSDDGVSARIRETLFFKIEGARWWQTTLTIETAELETAELEP